MLASVLQHCAETTETDQIHHLGQELLFWLTEHKGCSQKAGDTYKAMLHMGLCLGHTHDALRGERDSRARGQVYRVGQGGA